MSELEVYDTLRQMHSLLKDIIYNDEYETWSDYNKLPIEAVHDVLYLAERAVVQKDGQKK